MIVISWNCRELGNQCIVNALSFLVRDKVPNVLFRMEKKQTMDEMRKIQANLQCPNMLAVPSDHRRGGLAMFWTNDTNLHIQTYSPNHIDALIHDDPTTPW